MDDSDLGDSRAALTTTPHSNDDYIKWIDLCWKWRLWDLQISCGTMKQALIALIKPMFVLRQSD